jgi:hypothetical protein
MYPTDIFGKKILISPLNWGLGHVSRCIPLIKNLKQQNNHIFIACSKDQRKVFECYFDSDFDYINHEGYPFHFKGRGYFILDILMNMTALMKRHKSEHFEIKNLIDKHDIDIIISDHRYAFRSKKCISIFMTHQLNLPLPWYLKVGQFWHKNLVSKFDYQWVIDNKTDRLSGKLSNISGFPNAKYIGCLSRFENVLSENKKVHKGVLIVSGPAEYHGNLFQSFKKQIESGEIDVIIGNDKAFEIYKTLNFITKFHNSKDWKLTDEIISEAKKIFGYCGYSTLMDLHYLKIQAELMPCPGQREQIYLQKKVLRNSQDFL